MMSKVFSTFKRYKWYALFVVFVVVFDQLTKFLIVQEFQLGGRTSIIPGFLDFYHTQNTGIAFSIGGGMGSLARGVLFKIVPVFICFYIVKEFLKEVEENKILAIAYTLILGGAIGNLIDRIRLDYVVDFIAVYSNGGWAPRFNFAIFNIADSAVSIGAAFLIWHLLTSKKKSNSNVSEV